MSKTIIGFAGRKRAGKTSLSKYLTEKHNGTIVTVADALKHLCCDLLGFDTIEELNTYKDKGTSWSFNKIKEAPQWAKIICEQVFGEYTDEQYSEIVELLNGIYAYNVRELLQFVGTDIIRKFKPNWHVDKMVEAINNATTDLVCVDDVRFPNEREAIENLGGQVFFIMRPDLNIDVSNHESEVSLTWSDFCGSKVILNMFDLDFMFTCFDDAYSTDFYLTASNHIFGHANEQFCNENRMLGYIGGYKCTDLEATGMDSCDYDFIRYVVVGNIKQHNGCIVLHPTTENVMKYYYRLIYGHMPISRVYSIVVWNPYIIENLKAWM
ncbi:MAG: hypothetical protein IKO56_01580 [Alphaproteobacteria bacterium]|nr:hypothetical protein [Alphaproteobacteria bacterium]